MTILYEDASLVVCVKPVGVESEDAAGQGMPSLLRQALQLPDDAPIFTVHRLDKQVGGVQVYAKTKATAAHLSAQIQAHTFTKTYRAVIAGELPIVPTIPTTPRDARTDGAGHGDNTDSTNNADGTNSTDNAVTCVPTATILPMFASGRWEDLLYHDKRKNKVFTVKKERKGVKHAALRYQVLAVAPDAIAQGVAPCGTAMSRSTQSLPPRGRCHAVTEGVAPCASLLEIALETGRTHQIRVQCASRKHPLLGDRRYGSTVKACDIALFSHKLSFAHPKSGEVLTFTHNPPDCYPWNLF